MLDKIKGAVTITLFCSLLIFFVLSIPRYITALDGIDQMSIAESTGPNK